MHANHPFDVVGWDGCLYPWALSIHDFEPIVGRMHQPPPVHQTFAGPGFVDLLLRAAAVRLRSRRGEGAVPPRQRRLRRGALLLRRRLHEPRRLRHRQGLDQPSPGGVRPRPAARRRERSEGKDRTEELAVMMDTFKPLGLTDAGAIGQRPDVPLVLGGPCLTRGRRSPRGPTFHSRPAVRDRADRGLGAASRHPRRRPRARPRRGGYRAELTALAVAERTDGVGSRRRGAGRGDRHARREAPRRRPHPRRGMRRAAAVRGRGLRRLVPSIYHATNLGQILRPDSEPLMPNWRRIPVVYHGRGGLGGRVRHTGAAADRDGGVG